MGALPSTPRCCPVLTCETCMFFNKQKACTRFYIKEYDGHYNYDSAQLVRLNMCKGKYYIAGTRPKTGTNSVPFTHRRSSK